MFFAFWRQEGGLDGSFHPILGMELAPLIKEVGFGGILPHSKAYLALSMSRSGLRDPLTLSRV